ncbi:MAG: hypothetical protein IKD17_09170 [Alistipes sp.]|nr:hypothetical protein [Alistipes sp.]
MKLFRFFVVILAVTGSALAASAQTVSSYKEQLKQQIVSENAPNGANVIVTERDDAADVVRAADAEKHPVRLNGYRVCIFFDNSQNARAGAMEARQIFEEHYPGVPLYMEYENPYFRVTVGNCLSIEEAIILKGQVAEFFPKAFPKSQELTLEELLK